MPIVPKGVPCSSPNRKLSRLARRSTAEALLLIELSWVSASHRGISNHIFSRACNSGKPEVFFAVSTKQQSRLKYSQSLMSISLPQPPFHPRLPSALGSLPPHTPFLPTGTVAASLPPQAPFRSRLASAPGSLPPHAPIRPSLASAPGSRPPQPPFRHWASVDAYRQKSSATARR